MEAGATAPRVTRGRVVMLVDNGVNGDSRVQKAAEAAADAGWDVILLGKSPDGTPKTWQIGQARVRLIPMPATLGKRSFEFRRTWLRGPLGYPPTGVAAFRAQKMRAWQADLAARRAEFTIAAKAGGATGLRAALRRGTLQGEALAATVTSKWVSLRSRQLNSGHKARRRLDGPWDRAYALFWRSVQGDRAWRRLEPRLWEFELAFGKIVDSLRPDIIHANDFYMLGVGARALLRARAANRNVKLVWDAHELVSGLRARADNVRWMPAHIAHEREYARYADAAITVSPELAETLQKDHKLPELPTVVLNAPVMSGIRADEPAPDLREICGVGPDVPLLVYSGAVAPQRGIGTMIEALPLLDDVHIALVVAHPPSKHVQSLVNQANQLGVGNRVHLAPYVPHHQVVSYLSGADVGVIPLHHWPNHEIALITKFFEYAHARLPMVVSDMRAMAKTTGEIHQGEVFRAEDVEDYARAVRAVLSDRQRYAAAYDRPGLLENWTWEAQAKILDEVYTLLQPNRRRIRSGAAEVSVVVPVHNAMPHLPKCLYSLIGQSIGPDDLEIVVVDDGSTDESGVRLDRFARAYPHLFKVVSTGSPSGDPSVALNLGLAAATGRYVLFLQPDDHLGSEALERLVAVADEHQSDIVAPQAVDLRGLPTGTATPEDLPIVDFFGSDLLTTMSSTMLFRRELIDKFGVRFTEGISAGGETMFLLETLIQAGTISVAGGYVHHHATRRLGERPRPSCEARLDAVERALSLTERLLDVGPRREAVLLRLFAVDLNAVFDTGFTALDRDMQARIRSRGAGLIARYGADTVSHRLPAGTRVKFAMTQAASLDQLVAVINECAGAARDVPLMVEGDRAYLHHTGFRDADVGLPDNVFQVINDDLPTMMAERLTVTAIGWRGTGKERVLEISLHSPTELMAFGAAPLTITAGDVTGSVTLGRASGQSGTAVTARLGFDDLVAQAGVAGGRFEVKAIVTAFGATASARLAAPADVRFRRVLHYRGVRPYRTIAMAVGARTLVVDTAPVAVQRVARRLRRYIPG